MKHTRSRFVLAAALATGLLAVPAASAVAGEYSETVVVGHFNLKLKSDNGKELSVELACRPQGGSHPHADAACEDLDAADGHITDIPVVAQPCTKEFAPVTATATGVWDGGKRTFEKEYANTCQAITETGGSVFDFS